MLEHVQIGMIKEEWKKNVDGYVMEYNEDRGFQLTVFFANPTESEVESFSANKEAYIGVLEHDNIMFFLLKFGGCAWGDCTFSPNLYNEKPYFANLEDGIGYVLNVLLIDSVKGELKKIRMIGLGHELSIAIKQICEKQMQHPFEKDKYFKNITKIYNSYSTEQLLRMADERNIYKVGEVKNKGKHIREREKMKMREWYNNL